jgi:hypothetical protein
MLLKLAVRDSAVDKDTIEDGRFKYLERILKLLEEERAFRLSIGAPSKGDPTGPSTGPSTGPTTGSAHGKRELCAI